MRAMFLGLLFALTAGLMWGLVFVAPVMLPGYAPALLTVGRYLAFGLLALPLAWMLDRRALRELAPGDWWQAARLSLVGNFLYYLCLSAAIQRAGAPLPTMIIGTLPVVIAVTANLRGHRAGTRREQPLRWAQLAPSLGLIALGIALVNHVEIERLKAEPGADLGAYMLGAALAVGAVACWTWYPIRNAEWLRAHPDRSPRGWATAQGLATLPLALIGYAFTWAWFALSGSPFSMPFGPRAADFLLLMFAIGLLASWLGTLCWNEASQRLPPTIAGQLIVFETLSALAYAFVLRREWPDAGTLAGIALLVAGVLWALRSDAGPEAAEAHPH